MEFEVKPNDIVTCIHDAQSKRRFTIKRSSVFPYWTLQPIFEEEKTIEVSVPYTESQLSADNVEHAFEMGYKGTIEQLIEEMYEEGYNMEVFEE